MLSDLMAESFVNPLVWRRPMHRYPLHQAGFVQTVAKSLSLMKMIAASHAIGFSENIGNEIGK